MNETARYRIFGISRASRTLAFVSSIALLSAAFVSLPQAGSAWSGISTDNNAVCTAANNQVNPQAVEDGAGGVIIAWEDDRGASRDIYAQRLDSSGAPLWAADGVLICNAAITQENAQLVSDGSGGAVITWEDLRGSTTKDIYAQRINASGVVQWTANGVVICNYLLDQVLPQIASDGSGGAIITWTDNRNSSTASLDIYAQRISSGGAIQWTANGVGICTSTKQQYGQQVMSYAGGGAIIVWHDFRNNADFDVYAQRVNSSGAAQWPANGVSICTPQGNQSEPQMVSDGSGGAIITWKDWRTLTHSDIYAQRINSAGATQWTGDGVAISTSLSGHGNPQLATDGSGGAIITWDDDRGNSPEIYAQRVASSGSVQWTTDGIAICVTPDAQLQPQIVSDGSGGAVITWSDADIYAQRVNSSGAAQWSSNGVPICSATGAQNLPDLIPNGSGGAIIAWADYRVGGSDIYASMPNGAGQLPVTISNLELE